MLMRIKPGQQRRQTRAAQRRRHVAVREDGPLARQSIETRRQDDLVPHEAEVAPVHVVADHHDDVRRGAFLLGAPQRQR